MTRARRRGNWSTPEIDRLRELFVHGGVRHAAQVLRRSEGTILRKATAVFARKVNRGEWTREE